MIRLGCMEPHSENGHRLGALEREVERIRNRLHKLEGTVIGLELVTVKKAGPIIDELRAFENRVDKLATSEEVHSAIQKNTLSLGAKLWTGALSLALLALTILEIVKG